MTHSKAPSLGLASCAAFLCLLSACSARAEGTRPESDQVGEKKAAAEGNRHTEAGHFSYVPPTDWTVRDFAGMKFKICVGQPKNNFAPNLNVVDEAAAVEMADYRKATAADMPKILKEFKLLSDVDFKTDAGIQCARITYQQDFNGRVLQQVAYLFHNKAKATFYILMATTLLEDAKELEATFDAVARSFRWEQ